MSNIMAFVNTVMHGLAMSDRLNKSDWLRHGLRTLANDGAAALKVGPMAAALKVSRGSFYWHFRDLDDFRLRLLRRWQERTVDQVIVETEANIAEADRFVHLMKQAFSMKRNLDRAIRSWATQDQDVAAAVATVDARRVAYMANLLIASGVEQHMAESRAAFVYWAYLGQAIVMEPAHSAISESAMNDIGDLFVT